MKLHGKEDLPTSSWVYVDGACKLEFKLPPDRAAEIDVTQSGSCFEKRVDVSGTYRAKKEK